MKGRRQARMWAVQFLFQRDINTGVLDEALGTFWSNWGLSPSTKDKEFTEAAVRGVEADRERIDRVIAAAAENWALGRMGGVDRNAMRVAVWEMSTRSDIPPAVSINEAIESAKSMGSNESGAFVNGILDRVRKMLTNTSVHGTREP